MTAALQRVVAVDMFNCHPSTWDLQLNGAQTARIHAARLERFDLISDHPCTSQSLFLEIISHNLASTGVHVLDHTAPGL